MPTVTPFLSELPLSSLTPRGWEVVHETELVPYGCTDLRLTIFPQAPSH